MKIAQLSKDGEDFYPVIGSEGLANVIPITKGGTGADNVDDAQANLGISGIGTIYSAEWTASSCSTTNTAVSDSIDLPAGTYIIAAHCPTVNVTSWAFAINDQNASDTAVLDEKFQVAVVSYVELVVLHKFTSPAKIRILSAASVSATFSNLTRGGLYAMRIK